MDMIVLDEVLGEGTFGSVCTATVNGKRESEVLKVFKGERGTVLLGGELICPVGVNTKDELREKAERANSEFWNEKLWELLTSVVPEIAARGMGGADKEMHFKHHLMYVSGQGVLWGAVMPQVKPVSFALYKNMLEAERLEFVSGLQSALAKVHEQGYIHGDVKPDNVALSEGRVVLIDYGLVCAAPCVTRGRKSLYSPEFRAPEFKGKGNLLVTFAADVWAAGVTLLALERGHYNGKSFIRDLKLTSSWETNFEVLESAFPTANKRVLLAAASMLIVDVEKRASFVSKPAEVVPVPNYVGLLPSEYTFGACDDMQVIIHAREEYDWQYSMENSLTNWEMANLLLCAVDLFTRAYATGKTIDKITIRLLNCACLSLASVISSPGGRFVLMYKDFNRVQPGGLNFTPKDLVFAVNLVIEIVGGQLLPLGGGVRRQRAGLGSKELTIPEGKALWSGLRFWAALPLL